MTTNIPANANQLLEAILRDDAAAVEAAPLHVWSQARQIADGFHAAQYCAMLRFDRAARELQLQLANRWAVVYEAAYLLDWRDEQAA
jgi:hypothetical protein